MPHCRDPFNLASYSLATTPQYCTSHAHSPLYRTSDQVASEKRSYLAALKMAKEAVTKSSREKVDNFQQTLLDEIFRPRQRSHARVVVVVDPPPPPAIHCADKAHFSVRDALQGKLGRQGMFGQNHALVKENCSNRIGD